jgi:hypothetical protein
MYKNAAKHSHSFLRPKARSNAGQLAAAASDLPTDPIARIRKKWRKSGCTVYVLQFTHKKTALTFLKIGITRNALSTRFEADLDRYTVNQLSILSGVKRSDALILEKTLHLLFKQQKFIPPIPLRSGGNTECFTYSEELEAEIKTLLQNWNTDKDSSHRPPKVFVSPAANPEIKASTQKYKRPKKPKRFPWGFMQNDIET